MVCAVQGVVVVLVLDDWFLGFGVVVWTGSFGGGVFCGLVVMLVCARCVVFLVVLDLVLLYCGFVGLDGSGFCAG